MFYLEAVPSPLWARAAQAPRQGFGARDALHLFCLTFSRSPAEAQARQWAGTLDMLEDAKKCEEAHGPAREGPGEPLRGRPT